MTLIALMILAALVIGYVIANLRWQVWDAERRANRRISLLTRERIAEYR